MPRFDEENQNKRIAEIRREEEEELIRVLSQKYGHQYINLRGIPIDADALKLVDESAARAAELAPFSRTHKKLSVAIRNPNKKEAKDLIESLIAREFSVQIFMASSVSLEHAWERYDDVRKATASQHGVIEISAEDVKRLSETIKTHEDVSALIAQITASGSSQGISKILEAILGSALSLGASDVHIEPEDEFVRLRFRLDGVLWDIANIEEHTYALLRSRLKLLSGLKLNITKEGQDGRFTIDIGDKELEIRSSVIPGAYNESIVMRILDPSSIRINMSDLGINKYLLKIINEELSRPNGMIITTGPTGSGKTTVLYVFLKEVHRPEIKIITIEDPIEYHLEGVVQTQVSSNYSFANGLRSILRQDPDVIMVGEIRDPDVAATAMNSALTGHLVFSTLHTNSAVGSFPRLLDLGVDARTIGNAVNLVLGQRLVRRLCTHCKKERVMTEREIEVINKTLVGYPEPVTVNATTKVFDAAGCDKCGGSGYKGRVGVYEGIRVDPAVEKMVIDDPREDAILEVAKSQKIPTMQQDGFIKLIDGMTSFDELTRVIDVFRNV